jgi:hypothetical protein
MKWNRMLNEATVCSLCYCPNICFAWKGSVKTLCTQHDIKIILYNFNYLCYIHNMKTVNQVLRYSESAQISFHPGFIAKLCEICDFKLEVVYSIQ